MKTRFFITIGSLFIAAGLLLGYGPFMNYWHDHHPSTASGQTQVNPFLNAAPAVSTDPHVIQGKPVRIIIPSVNIDIPVANGYYNATSKTWTLSNDKAQYAVMTPEPNNQGGNTFIYGHNRPQVFSRLPKIKVGDIAIIITDQNHRFTYRFRSSYETDPNDDSLFKYQGKPIMTLQTCTGLWYQNRDLLTFDLIGAS